MIRVHSRRDYERSVILMETLITALADYYFNAWRQRRYMLNITVASRYYRKVKEIVTVSSDLYPKDVSWIVDNAVARAKMEYDFRLEWGKL